MVGVTQIHKQSWGRGFKKAPNLKQPLEGNTEMAGQLKGAY